MVVPSLASEDSCDHVDGETVDGVPCGVCVASIEPSLAMRGIRRICLLNGLLRGFNLEHEGIRDADMSHGVEHLRPSRSNRPHILLEHISYYSCNLDSWPAK